jgi:hypothetical protein
MGGIVRSSTKYQMAQTQSTVYVLAPHCREMVQSGKVNAAKDC